MNEDAKYYQKKGMEYYHKGDYPKAFECFFELKAIEEKTVGIEHPDYARTLNGLGGVYYSKGDYELAEKYLLDSKNIWEKKSEKENFSYATLLNNLAMLYEDIRNYDLAEKFYLEAKDILEKINDKDERSVYYAVVLNNIGELYCAKKNYNLAEKYYYESKSLLEKVVDKEHSYYASLLNNLAILYEDRGNYDLAEKCYLESIAIMEKSPGRDHPNFGITLDNMGLLYITMMYYDLAEKCYLESIAIKEKALGRKHPYYGASLERLCALYLTMEKYTQALTFKKEANQLNMDTVNRFFAFLSEQGREKYWNTRSSSFESSYSLSWFHPVPESNALNYDNALFTKGLLLRTTNAVRDSIYSSKDQYLIDKYEELSKLHQQIGYLRQSDDANEDYIKELENDAEEREKYLIRKSSVFRDFKASLTTGWQDVRRNLLLGEAAIEFASFELYERTWTGTTQYAALVVQAGIEAPVWIPLPNCEKAVLKFLNEKDFDKKDGSALYAAVWQPLESILKDSKTVYYSPSGLLYKISFNAIPTAEGVPLMDIYDLNLVSSTREIVNRKDKTTNTPDSGVVYGGLVYDVNEDDMKQEAKPYDAPDGETRGDTDLPDGTQRRGYREFWERLPGMGEEGKKVNEIMSENSIPTDLYKGTKGNKESFKKLSGKKKGVLHLATHGFFFGDIEKNNEERERLERIGGGKKVFENPLLRSGLVLAGANRAWRGEPVAGVENGILFADDVARMNLVGAQLVVLSACDTALGEVNNSEGVFGLQRAFKLAGAETLIMSLWRVDDEATCELMTSFYEKWLSEKKSKREAFKETQRQLREKYPSPYYWAAFVMID